MRILKRDLDFTELLPRISADLPLFEDITAYASAARGYLTGGYNWAMNPTRHTFHYDPEYTWNYEAGVKSMWMNGRLKANLSCFLY